MMHANMRDQYRILIGVRNGKKVLQITANIPEETPFSETVATIEKDYRSIDKAKFLVHEGDIVGRIPAYLQSIMSIGTGARKISLRKWKKEIRNLLFRHDIKAACYHDEKSWRWFVPRLRTIRKPSLKRPNNKPVDLFLIGVRNEGYVEFIRAWVDFDDFHGIKSALSRFYDGKEKALRLVHHGEIKGEITPDLQSIERGNHKRKVIPVEKWQRMMKKKSFKGKIKMFLYHDDDWQYFIAQFESSKDMFNFP